MKWQKNVMMKR